MAVAVVHEDVTFALVPCPGQWGIILHPPSHCFPVCFASMRAFRVKMMDGAAPHNQIDAEVAAGMGRPDNGPRLQVEDPAMIL